MCFHANNNDDDNDDARDNFLEILWEAWNAKWNDLLRVKVTDRDDRWRAKKANLLLMRANLNRVTIKSTKRRQQQQQQQTTISDALPSRTTTTARHTAGRIGNNRQWRKRANKRVLAKWSNSPSSMTLSSSSSSSRPLEWKRQFSHLRTHLDQKGSTNPVVAAAAPLDRRLYKINEEDEGRM